MLLYSILSVRTQTQKNTNTGEQKNTNTEEQKKTTQETEERSSRIPMECRGQDCEIINIKMIHKHRDTRRTATLSRRDVSCVEDELNSGLIG